MQDICEVCENEVTSDISILNGMYEGIMLCPECEEDMEAMIEAEDEAGYDPGEDEDEEEAHDGDHSRIIAGADDDRMPSRFRNPTDVDKPSNCDIFESLPTSAGEHIRNIAARILDCGEKFNDEATWKKYGLDGDREAQLLVVREVFAILGGI